MARIYTSFLVIFFFIFSTIPSSAGGPAPAGQRETSPTSRIVAETDTHHHASSLNPLAHAPIGVMGDHMHHAGEWMVSLRHMTMRMDGNRIGTRRVTDSEVLTVNNVNGPMPPKLRVVPQNMQMDMTMLGLMYAPNDDVTFMLMAGYLQNEMRLTTYNMMGNSIGSFTTRSEGLGDTGLTVLLRGPQIDRTEIHYGLGFNLPTGNIKKTDELLTPMNQRISARLPYAMQIGSGTYDFKPSLTVNHKKADIAYGAQISAILRLEDNNGGYSRGDVVALEGWVARKITQSVSASVRLKGISESKIDGKDALIDKPVQSANPNFYGGDSLHFGLGINIAPTSGPLAQKRLGLELTGPVYESLNGPQMSRDWSLTLGVQKSF